MTANKKQIGIILCFLALTTFPSNSNSETPESHCQRAVEHTHNIVLQSEMFKFMPLKDQESWKEDSLDENFIAENIKECAGEEYNKAMTDCVLEARTLQELKNCSPK